MSAETETERGKGNAPTLAKERIEQIMAKAQERLKEPLPEPKTLDMTNALRMMYPVLAEMRSKGYTLQMVRDFLAGEGVSISCERLSAHMAKRRREMKAESAKGPGASGANGAGAGNKNRDSDRAAGRQGGLTMRPDRAL